MPTDDRIEALLKYDPLAAAEDLLGHSYKEDQTVMMLGLLGTMTHGERKQKALEEVDDTLLNNDVARYERIIADEGFRRVLVVPFVGAAYGEGPVDERLSFWWHGDGLLLVYDTFNGNHVNSGHIYYNWRPIAAAYEGGSWHRAISSGGFDTAAYDRGDKVWVGHHDSREAVRFHLRRLRSLGAFVNPWVATPFLWFNTYAEKGDDYAAIRGERLSMLPADVRSAITGVFQ